MPELQTLDCLQPGLGKLERVKYFNRMLLTAEDMRTDQDFVLQKLRRHNRFLHGWGVVCGLIVSAAPTTELPWRVQIAEGYALGPFGDEIFVGAPVFMDLKDCGPGAATNPCEPNTMRETVQATGATIYLAIKYSECRARPVLAMPAGCGCEDEACEYSRIRDSFEIECLRDLPTSHLTNPNQPSLCDVIRGRALLACPTCPTEPQVVLARVTLPASRTTQVSDAAIDNKPPVRRILFSSAMLQEQIIKCCCGDRPSYPPPRREADVSVKVSVREIDQVPVRIRGFHYEIAVRNHSETTPARDVVVRDELRGIGFDINDRLVHSVSNHLADSSATWTDVSRNAMAAAITLVEPRDIVLLTFDVFISTQLTDHPGGLDNIVKVETLGSTDPNPGNNQDTVHVEFGRG